MHDMWPAIVSIVFIAMIAEVIKYNIKMKNQRPTEEKAPHSNKIDQLERRIESLESIIIELDKDRRFRDLK